MNKKRITAVIASACILAVPAAVILNVSNDNGSMQASAAFSENIFDVVGSDVYSILEDVSPSLTVEYTKGDEFSTVSISAPSEYNDTTKTLLILKPGADLSNVPAESIVAIDQGTDIIDSAVPVPVLEDLQGGTYTVFMGGENGNIYSGQFTIDADTPGTPEPDATTAPTPTTGTEAQPTPTTDTEVQPTPTTGTEVQPTPTTGTEIQPTPTTGTEAQPTPTTGTETQPTPTTGTEIQPTPTTGTEIQPTSDPAGAVQIVFENGQASITSPQNYSNVAVIFAEYKDGALNSVTVAPNVSSLEADRTVQAEHTVADGNTLKIFVWESTDTMKPVNANVTIK